MLASEFAKKKREGRMGGEAATILHLMHQLTDLISGARLGSIMGRIAKRLPSPVEYKHDEQETQTATCGDTPTTLRASVRVFSEVNQLSQEEQQEFWIAVEVEGALHNRVSLPDSTIDVIFVVDNA